MTNDSIVISDNKIPSEPKKPPLLYLVVHDRLLKIVAENSNIKPKIDFAKFRQVLSGYFRITKQNWFKIAKEMRDFQLIEFNHNSLTVLQIPKGVKK